MQRVIGAMLILASTTGAGILYGIELQDYLEKLMSLRRIVYLLKGELEYSGAPLGEVFAKVGRRVREPYRQWLFGIARHVESRSEDEFLKIWIRSIDHYLKDLKLKPDHVIQLKELGTCLGHFDSASESRSLQLYVERLELEIEKVRENMASKKRIGKCLGVMGGLFLIVVLI